MIGENELVITRIFDAPVELVWKMWTDPEQYKKWWGPRGFTIPFCKIDFRVGGRFLYCMKATQEIEGPDVWKKGIWNTGVYKEIVPLEKIVCTDSFADDKGNVVPATYYGMSKEFPLEMLVTVKFEEHNGKTEMTLRHKGIPSGTDSQEANQGWNESFDKLAESLKERST
jgi:uncharacterized protein YndB with AHSA1/START domain